MGDEHVKEASLVVNFITGISNYLYAINYDKEIFKQELEAAVEHIQKSAQA